LKATGLFRPNTLRAPGRRLSNLPNPALHLTVGRLRRPLAGERQGVDVHAQRVGDRRRRRRNDAALLTTSAPLQAGRDTQTLPREGDPCHYRWSNTQFACTVVRRCAKKPFGLGATAARTLNSMATASPACARLVGALIGRLRARRRQRPRRRSVNALVVENHP
jgi:hypothetical protein